jgi:L-threonylcarbamoyladenylate synthase
MSSLRSSEIRRRSAIAGEAGAGTHSAFPAMRRGTDIDEATRVLAAGGLVAFPTETVYGLGADASSPTAAARIFAAKGRPAGHPLIVHLPGVHLPGASGAADLAGWAREIPADAARLTAFWPGPLTLILRRGPRVALEVTGGADTVGLRVPDHPLAQALLRRFGGGVAAPSANRFGRISPTTADHVAAELGDAVDYILDGGPCAVGVESTIVDLSGPAAALLRPGGVPRAALEAALGHPLAAPTASAAPAPGTLESHYAPRATVIAVEPAGLAAAVIAAMAGGRVAVLAPAAVLAGLALPAGAIAAPLPDDDAGAARDLYAALRDLDATLVAALPPARGLGEAVADRLRRAGGPRSPTES